MQKLSFEFKNYLKDLPIFMILFCCFFKKTETHNFQQSMQIKRINLTLLIIRLYSNVI